MPDDSNDLLIQKRVVAKERGIVTSDIDRRIGVTRCTASDGEPRDMRGGSRETAT
jgi:hypothetical protein